MEHSVYTKYFYKTAVMHSIRTFRWGWQYDENRPFETNNTFVCYEADHRI